MNHCRQLTLFNSLLIPLSVNCYSTRSLRKIGTVCKSRSKNNSVTISFLLVPFLFPSFSFDLVGTMGFSSPFLHAYVSFTSCVYVITVIHIVVEYRTLLLSWTNIQCRLLCPISINVRDHYMALLSLLLHERDGLFFLSPPATRLSFLSIPTPLPNRHHLLLFCPHPSLPVGTYTYTHLPTV